MGRIERAGAGGPGDPIRPVAGDRDAARGSSDAPVVSVVVAAAGVALGGPRAVRHRPPRRDVPASARPRANRSVLRALAENCRSVRVRRRARLSKEAKCFRQSGLKLADSTVNGARVFRADPALNTTFSDYLSTRVHVLTYTYTFTTRAPSRSSSSAPGSPRATRFCSTHRSYVPRSGTNSGSSSANPIR